MKILTPSSVALAAAFLATAISSHAAVAVGLTSSGLVRFDTDSPATILGTASFSGLGTDTIVDIDYRPADGQLYGMASSGRLYVIDSNTGSATISTSAGVGPLGIVQTIDFNPVANRLRVYSAGDANYRLTPGAADASGVTSDGTLAYIAGDVNVGQSPNLRAAAYTNSFAGSAVTTLYSIDADFDTLVVHSGGPQFNGLGTVGELNLNGLFINFGNSTGFDILSAGGLNTAYVSNGNAFYELDLATGDLVPLGSVGGPATNVGMTSFALVPEPGAALLAALPLGLLAFRRRRQA